MFSLIDFTTCMRQPARISYLCVLKKAVKIYADDFQEGEGFGHSFGKQFQNIFKSNYLAFFSSSQRKLFLNVNFMFVFS